MKFLRTNLLLAFACAFSLNSFATLNAKNTHSSHKSSDVYDYIIVGNGTAGAVLARKLSDNHKNKVLVLETGANLSEDPVGDIVKCCVSKKDCTLISS